MKSFLFSILLFLACTCRVSGMLIPYYTLDSLAYMSSDVVLCEEGEYLKVEKKDEADYGSVYYEVKFTVVNAFKGNHEPGDQITVVLPTLYVRRLANEAFSKPREEHTVLPKGKALLFLNRQDKKWTPVPGGVKLIIGDVVYCYGQFVTNPGGLWLRKMPPENIRLEDDQSYGPDLLLKDLAIALRRTREKDLTQKRLILGGEDPFDGDPFSNDFMGMDPFEKQSR